MTTDLRRLDAAVAEGLGLEVFLSKEDYFNKGMPHAMTFQTSVEYPAYYHARFQLATIVPHYSTDIAAARQMEDWVKDQRPHLVKAYTEALCTEVGYSHHWANINLLWHVAHATPEQRCRAFLRAVGREVE